MTDLFIIGSSRPETAVGNQLHEAARQLGLQTRLIELSDGHGTGIARKLTFKLLGDYPLRGRKFNDTLLAALDAERPRYLLSTGKAPIFAETLQEAENLSIHTVNFSTDDPWNPLYRARWALDSLKAYSKVATPRTANLHQVQKLAQGVEYVQFGYSPSQHFWTQLPENDHEGDVFFAGGCDEDRAPYFKALIHAGIRPALYGGYWADHDVFRPYHRGMASLSDMRRLHAEIPISVCLVRRANRDGHVMRTFEAPAMGACLAMEDTEEHRAIFGQDGDNVVYFSDPKSLILACRRLLDNSYLRRQLRENCHQLITAGGHTYADRLKQMLNLDPQS